MQIIEKYSNSSINTLEGIKKLTDLVDNCVTFDSFILAYQIILVLVENKDNARYMDEINTVFKKILNTSFIPLLFDSYTKISSVEFLSLNTWFLCYFLEKSNNSLNETQLNSLFNDVVTRFSNNIDNFNLVSNYLMLLNSFISNSDPETFNQKDSFSVYLLENAKILFDCLQKYKNDSNIIINIIRMIRKCFTNVFQEKMILDLYIDTSLQNKRKEITVILLNLEQILY